MRRDFQPENLADCILLELRAARERVPLTQLQAAEKVGASAATVSRWESGEAPLSLNAALFLAELYGVPARTLLENALRRWEALLG